MDYKAVYLRWMDSPALGEAEWQELAAIQNDEEEIKSRFYTSLTFGTAGLRGIMALGTNRMNVHVIRHATQAFANVINREGPETAANGVVICFDCRINSEDFAREAACVMAANGIPVRLFESLRPTPELSFAIRHYGAAAGINITASHNPKEYNGYKVYWSDGAQLPPAHADAIEAERQRTDIFSGVRTMGYGEALAAGKIRIIGEETDEAFLEQVLSQAIRPETVKQMAEEFKLVYTPFHGAGYRLVPEALRRLGIRHLHPVPEQMVIDGNFPTVKSPNPEEPAGFALAVELAKQVDCDLIIGTDPDSDRVAALARRDGAYIPISGNQMGVLLLDYIIRGRRETGTMPENPVLLKTIVSTEMAAEVARRNGVLPVETFTGFKFMAEKIAQFESENSHHYILAFEESIGYMCGPFVRDKDAVTASMLIAEMGAWYESRGMTLLDALDELYKTYGYYAEKTLNLVMPGIDGQEKMASLMEKLRQDPPKQIGAEKVLRLRDYQSGRIRVPELGEVAETMVNSLETYDKWEAICGEGRIIPAFPGAGGGFDGNVLDAALTPRLIQPTTFGKTGGRERALARVLHQARIPCQIVPDMHAWQLCHLAMVVPIADAYYEAADPKHAGRDAALMRKTAKQIRDNLDAIAARKIRLSPGKMQAFRLLPTPLVGWILGFVFQSSFGDRFMYRHSMRAPDEMRQLHEQFYRWLE